VKTLEGASQTIAQGPVASQEAIKELGTNGGGFFNANSAHPFENPTPFTSFFEALVILAIPAGLAYMVGKFAGDARQGWVLLAAMVVLFVVGLAVVYGSERAGNPNLSRAGANQAATAGSSGGNMEGKETRLGIAQTAIFANATTGASCGAVVSSHDSFTPLAGGMAMLNIALGEIVFGGVGSGLYGMLIFAIIAVFIAGLMVGRTPEYLGKKIQAREVQMAMLYALVFPAAILTLTALSAVLPAGLAGLANGGPHGLSEILYAFTSTAGNNGSAFAGLTGSTYYYNTLFGLNTLVGRFAMMVPMIALGGFLAEKKVAPESAGTFPVTGPLFVTLLVGVILIVSALTFFPALSLGPIVEQLLMGAGRVF
jgi:K+-transporting ATPase ATPase A chain